MLTGLMLGEMPPKYPALEGYSLPPASTKKPLENEEKRRSRKDMKGEKTVDRQQNKYPNIPGYPPATPGKVILRYQHYEDGKNPQFNFMWVGYLYCGHRVCVNGTTPEEFLDRAKELFPGWDVQIEEEANQPPSSEASGASLPQAPE